MRLLFVRSDDLSVLCSYWLGSQSAPPIYQYRIILPSDDRVINVATDMDFNVEGEVKASLTPNISAKTTFVVRGVYVCVERGPVAAS